MITALMTAPMTAPPDESTAEPLLGRAPDIQEKIQKSDSHLTVAILNTLGNLLEGKRQMDEAERLEIVQSGGAIRTT